MFVTYEDFYGDVLPELRRTEKILLELIEKYCGAFGRSELKPVVYFCSRMKAPESVLRKCRIQGFEESLDGALDNLYDLVGIRVVCAFNSDVYHLAEWLRQQPEIRIDREKDYYDNPKPNGYRSFHIQLKVPGTGMPAEIQLRTIATDFWATLEHQLKYKKQISDENMIRGELKRCADEIASVDISMQTIREIIAETIPEGGIRCLSHSY